MVEVELTRIDEARVRVSVTVAHDDEGWDHYADRWVVVSETGAVLAERVLLHPHVDEQPFTRSTIAELPVGSGRVRVRARDTIHGEGPASEWLQVPD